MKGNVVFLFLSKMLKKKKPENEQIIDLRAGPEISIYQYGSPEHVLAAVSEVVVSTTMERRATKTTTTRCAYWRDYEQVFGGG